MKTSENICFMFFIKFSRYYHHQCISPSIIKCSRFKNFFFRNRVTRTDPLIMSHFYSQPIEIQPAPLATPEAVDFSPAYSLVNVGFYSILCL